MEHFVITCRISKDLWKIAYETFEFSCNLPRPVSTEEVITAANAKGPHLHTVMVWLHIIIVYELWVLLTNKRWGRGSIPEPALGFIWKHRIKREIQVALANRKVKDKEKALLGWHVL